MAHQETARAGNNVADDETLQDGAATSALGQIRSELTSRTSMSLHVEFGTKEDGHPPSKKRTSEDCKPETDEVIC